VEELSRWCGRCGTELRSGARFCSTCGQRVINEEPAPLTGLDALFAAPTPAPEQPSAAAVSVERDDWSHWYADTAPRSPFQPPANQQPADQQPADQRPSPSPSPFYPQPRPGGPGGPGGSSGRERRSRAPLLWSVLSVAVVAAVVVFLFLLHPFNHHATVNDAANSTGTTAPASAAATSSPAASAARSASSAAVTEHQAASTVAGMLASSVADRTAIDDAYNDVDSCGPNLDGDAAVFTRAANSRRAMLASLASMPGRSALPPALLSDLANAWQASLSADQDLATWASDEAAKRCVPDDTSDPGYQATATPDNEANQAKTAFVAQWNPIASSYGLTTYQQDQL
jgi:hypothetical protein